MFVKSVEVNCEIQESGSRIQKGVISFKRKFLVALKFYLFLNDSSS